MCKTFSLLHLVAINLKNSILSDHHKVFFPSIYVADLPQELDMFHELVPLEPQHNVNKSSIFGYATSVYKVCVLEFG